MAHVAQTHRPLGTSGLDITEVGFGAWALGGGGWAYGWGAQDDTDSLAAIHHALDRGINWIDTAAVYGYGHSEAVVGQALRSIPAADRPLVFTKGGMVWDSSDPYREPLRDLRPQTIRREVEESLRRLGVERVDLYQFHWPDQTGTPVEESWGELGRLVDEGKVAHPGVCNFSVELLERCERVRHVDSLQPPFSLVRRGAGADLLPWCAAHGTGVIVYSPMQSGLLTGRFSAEHIASLAEDDWRRRASEFTEPELSRNLALVEALRPIAARVGATLPELVVAWTLSWSGVTAAIVGARTPEQVDGWIEAPSRVLSAADMRDIARAIEATGAGAGPALPAELRA